jgi:hypothetical protein
MNARSILMIVLSFGLFMGLINEELMTEKFRDNPGLFDFSLEFMKCPS